MRPVSDTKWVECVMESGDKLVFAARPEMRDRHKSVVLLIHDILGSPGEMADWFGLLEPEAEVLLMALPGHGRGPPVAVAGVEALAGMIESCLRFLVPQRRVLVVGEGLGGVLALAMNARGYASVAVDPFFSSVKLGPLEERLAQGDLDPDFLFQMLGWRDRALAENRNYAELLDRLKAPALVICGDAPAGGADEAPSLLDEADHALLAAYPDVRVETAEGCGHQVLRQAPDFCRDLILDELSRA